MASSLTEDDVEREFLRLVSMSSENVEQLEGFLARRLVPLLASLAPSTQPALRNKVTELLNHLSRRLKANDAVQLPISALLTALEAGNVSPQLALHYLKLGFPRMGGPEQRAVLPQLLRTVPILPTAESDAILELALPGLLALVKLKGKEWPALGLKEQPKLRAALLDYLLDLLIAQAETDRDGGEDWRPPGLSERGWSRVRSYTLDGGAKLKETKVSALRWVSEADLKAEEIGAHIVMGLIDPIPEVSLEGETRFKRLGSWEVLELRPVLMSLGTIFLGHKDETLPARERRKAADLRIRLALLTHISRSTAAAALFPLNVKIIFESLFGKSDTGYRPRNPLAALLAGPDVGARGKEKLQAQAALFASSVVRACPDSAVPTFVPMIFTGCKTLLTKTENSSVAAKALGTLAVAGLRCPNLVTADLALVNSFFLDSTKENEEASDAMLDCLTSWLPLFRDLEPAQRNVMTTLINTYLEQDHKRCQQTALKFVEVVFPAEDVPSRWHLLKACNNPREDVRREAARMLREPAEAGTLPPFTLLMKDLAGRKLEVLGSRGQVEACHLSRAALLAQARLSSNNLVYHPEDRLLFGSKLSGHVRDLLSGMEEDAGASIGRYARLLATAFAESRDAIVLGMLAEVCQASQGDGKGLLSSEFVALLETELFSTGKLEAGEAGAEVLAWHYQLNGTLEKATVDATAKLQEAEGRIGEALLLGQTIWRLPPGDTASAALAALVDSVRPARPLPATEAAILGLTECLKQSPCPSELSSSILEKLSTLATSIKDSVKLKLRERAVTAMGFLTVDGEKREQATKALIGIGEGPPQPELQFAVGDALVDVALGTLNPLRRQWWLQSHEEAVKVLTTSNVSSEGPVGSLLDAILDDKLKSRNPHLRLACLVWLSRAAERIGDWHPALSARLPRLHKAFVDGLMEKQDLAQEVSSSGLGLVYELAGDKEGLVSALSDSFNKDSGNLAAKALIGNSITLCGELCALATRLEQPALVYSLLQLAYENFGQARASDGRLRQRAVSELQAQLPRLIPSLYRSQYDVHSKIRAGMKSVWQAVTAGQKAVLDKHSEAILDELLTSLTDPQWPVRESSCLALSDLLSARGGPGFASRLPEAWGKLFLLCDDVKESVRLAAEKTLSRLSRATLALAEGTGSGTDKVVAGIVRILLSKGLSSGTESSRIAALSALTNLGKSAGKSVAAEAGVVVPALLRSLSELEPAMLNYLAVRADEEMAASLDAARSAAARSSPSMTALRGLLPLLTPNQIKELIPTLADLLRNPGVGLATRTGAASFVQYMTQQCPRELMGAGKSSADKVAKALESGLTDRSPNLRRQFATTLGSLAKFISHSALDAIVNKLLQRYLDPQGCPLATKVAVASAFQCLGHQSSESLKDLGPRLAPIAFLALSQEAVEAEELELKRSWEEVWNELAPGESGGLRQYRTEVLNLLTQELGSSGAWAARKAAAIAIARAAPALRDSLSKSELADLITAVLAALSGRTWDGKEAVLAALAALGNHLVQDNARLGLASGEKEKVSSAVLKECGKRCVAYRSLALHCAGDVSLAVGHPTFSDLHQLTKDFLTKEESVVALEDDAEDIGEVEKKSRESQFDAAALVALSKALRSDSGDSTSSSVVDYAGLLESVLPKSRPKVQAAVLEELGLLFKASVFLNRLTSPALFSFLLALISTHDSAPRPSTRQSIGELADGLALLWSEEGRLQAASCPADQRARFKAYLSERANSRGGRLSHSLLTLLE